MKPEIERETESHRNDMRIWGILVAALLVSVIAGTGSVWLYFPFVGLGPDVIFAPTG